MTTNSSLKTLSEDAAESHLTAEFEVLEGCSDIDEVKVKSVTVDGQNVNLEYDRIGFFKDRSGKISSLCKSNAVESVWSVNLKKGILSALQNTHQGFAKSTDEASIRHSLLLPFKCTCHEPPSLQTDVLGTCPTLYEPTGEFTHEKVKVLDSCTDNSRHKQRPQWQNMPLLTSTYKCQVRTNDKRQLQRSSCKETRVFKPFQSSGSSGAVTEQRQIVSLISEEKDFIPSKLRN